MQGLTNTTRTGLKFARLANGAFIAQYKTHSGTKAADIRAALTLLGYTSKISPLLHTSEHLVTVTVANSIKEADILETRSDFKRMWREMRAEQKAAVSTFDGEPDATVED